MSARSLGWCVLSLVLVVTGTVLLHQRGTRAELALQLEAARTEDGRAAAMRAENERLAASLPPPADMARLREDRAALGTLRAEVAALRETGQVLVARVAATKSGNEKPDTSELLRERRRVPTEQLTNKGWKTSLAAFETFMWTAATGDVDALASALVFDPRFISQVERLWADLSPQTRSEYRSVERLFAAMTIRDVPLGTVQLMNDAQLQPGDHFLPGPGHAFLTAGLTGADKKTLRVGLYFRPAEQGFQLLVPGTAVTKYREQLLGKSVGSVSGSP